MNLLQPIDSECVVRNDTIYFQPIDSECVVRNDTIYSLDSYFLFILEQYTSRYSKFQQEQRLPPLPSAYRFQVLLLC